MCSHFQRVNIVPSKKWYEVLYEKYPNCLIRIFSDNIARWTVLAYPVYFCSISRFFYRFSASDFLRGTPYHLGIMSTYFSLRTSMSIVIVVRWFCHPWLYCIRSIRHKWEGITSPYHIDILSSSSSTCATRMLKNIFLSECIGPWLCWSSNLFIPSEWRQREQRTSVIMKRKDNSFLFVSDSVDFNYWRTCPKKKEEYEYDKFLHRGSIRISFYLEIE